MTRTGKPAKNRTIELAPGQEPKSNLKLGAYWYRMVEMRMISHGRTKVDYVLIESVE